MLHDVTGLEAFFVKDIEYYIRNHEDNGYFEVQDRFGQWRVVNAARLEVR